MQARGELKCLNCSRFLGEVEEEAGSVFRLVHGPSRAPQAAVVRCGKSSFCCGHCGGRAIIEEWRVSRKPVESRAA